MTDRELHPRVTAIGCEGEASPLAGKGKGEDLPLVTQRHPGAHDRLSLTTGYPSGELILLSKKRESAKEEQEREEAAAGSHHFSSRGWVVETRGRSVKPLIMTTF